MFLFLGLFIRFYCSFLVEKLLFNSLCLSVIQSVFQCFSQSITKWGKCVFFSAAIEDTQLKFTLKIPMYILSIICFVRLSRRNVRLSISLSFMLRYLWMMSSLLLILIHLSSFNCISQKLKKKYFYK